MSDKTLKYFDSTEKKVILLCITGDTTIGFDTYMYSLRDLIFPWPTSWTNWRDPIFVIVKYCSIIMSSEIIGEDFISTCFYDL